MRGPRVLTGKQATVRYFRRWGWGTSPRPANRRSPYGPAAKKPLAGAVATLDPALREGDVPGSGQGQGHRTPYAALRPMDRRELFRVRLSRHEIAAPDRLRATRGGLTRSELVRRLIKEAQPSPPPPPSLDQLLAAVAAPPRFR
jgi:hypothetical protein